MYHLHETPQSRAGEYYRAANGQKIYQEGERLVSMMTQEGALRDMRFTVCDVAKALGSVSQMCRTGHRVVFNPPWSSSGSYIEQVATGERIWLQEEGGLYVLNTKVAPAHRQTARQKNEVFIGKFRPHNQGAPEGGNCKAERCQHQGSHQSIAWRIR